MSLQGNTSLNNSISSGPAGLEKRSTAIVASYTVFYMIVISTAICGNTLVILTVYKNHFMRTVVNLFFANLACSDLLFALLSLFDFTAYMKRGWYATEAICKIQSYLIEVSYTCSTLTLVAVSIERFLSVCKPHMKGRTLKTTCTLIAFVWFVSVGFCAVLLYAYRIRFLQAGVPICENSAWTLDWRRIFYTIHSIFIYLIPLSVMIWAHHMISKAITLHRVPTGNSSSNNKAANNTSGQEQNGRENGKDKNQNKRANGNPLSGTYKTLQGKRKVIKILIVVTVTFFALWTPFIFTRLIMYFGVNVNDYIWKATQLLILSSTAVNSIIYAFMSPQFRKSFKDFLPCFESSKRKMSSSFWDQSPSREKSFSDRAHNSVSVKETSAITRDEPGPQAV